MTETGPPPPPSRKAARKALADRLGHRFKDGGLLDQALTHSSLEDLEPGLAHNQRLEFLGDRVIGLVVADSLFSRLSDGREGVLTARHHECVSNRTLARLARDIGVGDALDAQPGTSLADTDTVLADALEAVIGAIWRDGGMEAARKAILRVWGEVLDGDGDGKDSKTRLQEHALGRRLGLPVYELVGRLGPDHAPEFRVAVTLEGRRAEGTGPSKREAEQVAASALLGDLP